MSIFGFDLTSVVEHWMLICVCTGLADGIVRGFWRAYKQWKEENKDA